MWRDFSNLPRFMNHLESVQVIDQRRSHWKTKAPAGKSVEWDAEIIEDRPGELIAWRSLEGSQIGNSGVVRFIDAPGDRGTEVHVELEYQPPLGTLGVVFARLLGEEPEQQAADGLRRFKQILETGRVPWSAATRRVVCTPHGPATATRDRGTRRTAGTRRTRHEVSGEKSNRPAADRGRARARARAHRSLR